MDYERFLATVEQATGVGRQAARQATRATLETLEERAVLDEDRAWRASEANGGKATRISADEFVDRAAQLPSQYDELVFG